MSGQPGWRPAPGAVNELEWWDGYKWSGVRSSAPTERAGWFANRNGVGWRWWARNHWTAYQRDSLRRPLLPVWISVPVLAGLIVALRELSGILGTQLELLALSAIPVAVLLVAFLGLNHVHPLPSAARWHAFAWGAVVAGTAAGYINEAVAVEWGEVAAVVVSAPVGEELLKGFGVLVAVHRREIANQIHGAVIALWVAAGFTLTEELVYLSLAFEEGNVAATFVERGIFGAFVHPLATVWIGLAVGGAVEGARRVGPRFMAGLVLSIALHAGWNSAAVLASDEAAGNVYLVYLVVLAATIGLLVRQRRQYANQHERTAAAIRRAALGVGLSRHEVDVLGPFLSSASARAFRQGLPRERRASFDTAHAAIARSFAEVKRRGTVTPAQIGQMRDFARATTALR